MRKSDRKLIALDLDGTLLNKQKKITPRTKGVLEEAMRMGHHVVIATGRPPRASLNYYHELGLHTPMVNFNGALVHHAVDEEWGHHHFPLERATALQVLDVCEQFGIHNVMAEIKDDFYLKQHDAKIVNILGEGRQPLAVGAIHDLLHDHPTSLLIQAREEVVSDLRAHLHQHHADLIEHRYWGTPWNVIEVMKAGVNKATGLSLIVESLGLNREQVIAFGDEDNDFAMIEYAGLGVAMGNANLELKAIADSICDTNDNDGIAQMLERLL
ncbi:Cof-type HAD-IIB family hydrolase [Tumebacillus lipolyticus]|uniref:Cof-type HAD-IIB family hydrolase n=1 Tax=Tumebacillus lipolyticus TaxID=1280370 RepID=A0ABW4ZUY6_9BACL